ncbi:hypothetical protein GCM10023174_07210 [Chelativorans composti]
MDVTGKDVLFDDKVGRTADEDQVLHIVPPHEDQAALRVHRHGVHHGEPRRPVPPARNRKAGANAADKTEHHEQRDQRQQRKDNPHYGRNGIRAEGCFQHVRHQLSPRYDMDMLLAFPCPNPRQRGRRSRTFRASVKVGGVESAGKHEANLSSGL